MITQINADPRLNLDIEALNTAVGSPVIATVTEFTADGLTSITDAFSLAHTNKQTVIPVVINSYGGDVYYLQAMLSLFHQSQIPIATIVEGMAMSAGSLLFAMGTKGMRYISPEGTLMIHEIALMAEGSVEILKADTEQLEKLNTTIYKSLAKNCGKPENYFTDRIHEHCHGDWYLDADMALEHSLADHIGVPRFVVNVDVKYLLI